MEQIHAPEPLRLDCPKPRVFLGGSIEMGTATDWQVAVTQALADLDILICNPRRKAWDASWPNTIDFQPFREQVEWELEALERADLILFYFDPQTKAPITLLELGLHARRNVIVCCPEGYWRKGNVDIVCRRYGIRQVDTLEKLITQARQDIAEMSAQ
ncbi:MAG TPA: nucleoside 2-deoxyribosyltransferase domain-containing protein [Polyangium sp.]|nr:nucleoside 2-deoxyribosyltransferase domain-containing protein [Polyangium sp.]